MSTDEAAFVRQEQILAGLYGPATAAELVAKLREVRAADPDGDFAAQARSVEPNDEDDWDEAGAMRPI